MARWALRCHRCRQPLGWLTRVYRDNGTSKLLLRPTAHTVRFDRRLLSGRWAVCECGAATKLPADCEVRD